MYRYLGPFHTVKYNIDAKYEDKDDNLTAKEILEWSNDLNETLKKIPIPGTGEITYWLDKIIGLIETFMPDDDNQQKAEAILVGSEAYRQFLLWFNEIESGK